MYVLCPEQPGGAELEAEVRHGDVTAGVKRARACVECNYCGHAPI